ncbi:M15 family metallopeptidase [Geomicrobium sediminis]|uniref:D-alanyl-D-alanine carboxypeptidase n=1 Tax=Geomicrobium sediminis TaxID=1347788 RepID=A0ABS2PCE1_9BACL|nr:M15 family metallopeptidase [Geomicrobium sediminis]MBM7633097.1 D-alanyl-D-alanine carboxypeptidase [Geomicrobium sediminis]
MRTWVLYGFFLVITVIVSMILFQAITDHADVNVRTASHEFDGREITIDPDEVNQGSLVLVNQEYPMNDAFTIEGDLVTLFEQQQVTTFYSLLNEKIQLPLPIAEKFNQMVNDAHEDGVEQFLLTSGYRDNEAQARQYDERGSDYAMPPGFSEHNTGLALDISSIEGPIESSTEGRWVEEHSWKHGFVIRYPKGKEEVTGIQYEPWHLRYVGIPHSVIMHEKGFVLEEYIDFLEEEKSLVVELDSDEAYAINYYPKEQLDRVVIPNEQPYEISGTNKDGIVVVVEL